MQEYAGEDIVPQGRARFRCCCGPGTGWTRGSGGTSAHRAPALANSAFGLESGSANLYANDNNRLSFRDKEEIVKKYTAATSNRTQKLLSS